MERRKHVYGVNGLLESVRQVVHDGVRYYALLDVIALLAETDRPGEAWAGMVRAEPGLERLVARLGDLEMVTVEGVLRVAQSVPMSARAERVRQWLAASGRQRLEEAENPELALARVRAEYERKGRDRRWVDKRLRGMSARQELTSEWARRGATESDEYRALTNELMQAAFAMDVETYRRSKSLTGTTANLRDHMSDLELVLTMLGETAATTLHRQHGSSGFGSAPGGRAAGGADHGDDAGGVPAVCRAAAAAPARGRSSAR